MNKAKIFLSQVYQETFMKWLVLLLSYVEDKKSSSNLKCIITVALVVVLSINKESIHCKDLSIVLFQMLQIGELDNDESMELLDQILCMIKYYESIG